MEWKVYNPRWCDLKPGDPIELDGEKLRIVELREDGPSVITENAWLMCWAMRWSVFVIQSVLLSLTAIAFLTGDDILTIVIQGSLFMWTTWLAYPLTFGKDVEHLQGRLPW